MRLGIEDTEADIIDTGKCELMHSHFEKRKDPLKF